MIGGSSHLGQRQLLVPPRNDVASAGDLHAGRIIAPLDFACAKDFKQLRMQRSAIELKCQFGNFGANGKHKSTYSQSLIHSRSCSLYPALKSPTKTVYCRHTVNQFQA